MSDLRRRWTHLSPSSASVPNTTNPALHPYQNPSDTRTSSTASLLPPPSAIEDVISGRSSARTLLCVFIHGFVGDETSFRSFPAHFHELLTILVEETHIVHTKIYPKFKTRDKISIAVENFSRWLSQFESPTTDIILLGHSMGGLLAADVCLLQPLPPGRHRILGHISFDVPFIGIHPGVIKSGLASLFKPAEKPPPDPEIVSPAFSPRHSLDENTSLYTTTSGSSMSTYEPPILSPKKSPWAAGMNFLKKHQGGVRRAALAYVNGHLEFSGALMDIKTMRTRYERIKALEKANPVDRRMLLLGGARGYDQSDGVYVPRVRFLNYYTVSTGRVKREKSKTREASGNGAEGQHGEVQSGEIVDRGLNVEDPGGRSSGTPSPLGGTPAIATNGEVLLEAVPSISPLPSPHPQENETSSPPPAYTVPGRLPVNMDQKTETQISSTGVSPGPETAQQPQKEAKKKEKTFCITPREPDSCWVKVNMENVDEVGAHCGLFFINGVPGVETPAAATSNSSTSDFASAFEAAADDARGRTEEPRGGFETSVYDRLLGDVTQRIEMWCREWVDELRMDPQVLEAVYGNTYLG